MTVEFKFWLCVFLMSFSVGNYTKVQAEIEPPSGWPVGWIDKIECNEGEDDQECKEKCLQNNQNISLKRNPPYQEDYLIQVPTLLFSGDSVLVKKYSCKVTLFYGIETNSSKDNAEESVVKFISKELSYIDDSPFILPNSSPKIAEELYLREELSIQITRGASPSLEIIKVNFTPYNTTSESLKKLNSASLCKKCKQNSLKIHDVELKTTNICKKCERIGDSICQELNRCHVLKDCKKHRKIPLLHVDNQIKIEILLYGGRTPYYFKLKDRLTRLSIFDKEIDENTKKLGGTTFAVKVVNLTLDSVVLGYNKKYHFSVGSKNCSKQHQCNDSICFEFVEPTS